MKEILQAPSKRFNKYKNKKAVQNFKWIHIDSIINQHVIRDLYILCDVVDWTNEKKNIGLVKAYTSST